MVKKEYLQPAVTIVNVVINQTNGGTNSTGTSTGVSGVVGGIGKAISNSANHSLGYDLTHMDIFTGGVEKDLNNLGEILKFMGIEFKANGGFVGSGDLFVANEAGPELIGSINGRTAVANQEQIIEGIQRGVSEANQTQNELLRQQNELLRGILEKEGNVNIGASVGLARVVNKSMEMYNRVGG